VAAVAGGYQHSAVASLDEYVYASAGERTGVLYQWLQHAHGDLGLDVESTSKNEVVFTVEVSASGYALATAEVTKADGTGEKAGE
jgi:hypothetical protein